MALTTVDFSSYFNYKLPTKQITFTDKTDFVAQGTVAANVTVVAKVTAPVSGVIYNNTNHSAPDIDCGTSLDSVIEIALPLDVNSNPEQGVYEIELTYQDLIVPSTVIETRTFNLNYTSPTVDLTMEVDCVTPLLTATDTTSYTQNTIDPTITRAIEINYPLSLNIASVTGTANVLTTRNFYVIADQTVEHSSSLVSNLSYLFDVANSMYVIDEISGSEFIEVACDGDLCDIYCCIRSQYMKWQDAKGVNNVKATAELAKFKQITSIAEMVGIALKCSKSSHISEYVAEILKIADCDSGCGCADGEPQLVTGLSITGDVVLIDAGTGIEVNKATGGGTTTYTVGLNTVNANKLNQLVNTVVTAGSNVTVTKTTNTVPDVDVDTYEVSATDTVIESLFVRARVSFSFVSVPTVTLIDQKIYGTHFTTVSQTGSPFITIDNSGTYSDFSTNYVGFTVDSFGGSDGVSIHPEVMITQSEKFGTNPLTSSSNIFSFPFKAQLVGITSTQFELRFTDSDGNLVNGALLGGGFDHFDLIFKIHA